MAIEKAFPEQEFTLPDISKMTGSLAQRVYLALRSSILSVDLLPGDIIRKKSICDQLGVSRSPVSEAITKLALEGLVEVIPQSASRVTKLSLADIREGAFLREAVELAAITKVAVEHSEAELALLKRNIRLQALCLEDKDEPGFFAEDERMHQLILSFTGFPKIEAMSKTAWVQVDRARQFLLPIEGRAYEAYREHLAILDAIESRDAQAARNAMQKHLSELVNRLEPLAVKRPELFD
ncbi:MAG: GntR family transcriptional regulator [Rhodobacteraceae bacterium]|nr:GntR family transcriptional regulator [Paracoccaceae bacterium]